MKPVKLDPLSEALLLQSRSIKPPSKSAGSKERLQALGRLKPGEMNKTDASYRDYLAARLMAGEILWWAFDSIKLKLAPKTHITVDFAVLRADGVLEMHDVKGAEAIVEDDARAKMKVAAVQFPLVFKFVYPVPKNKGGGWREVEV